MNVVADDPPFDVRASCVDAELELRRLVFCVYVRALETLPALVRQWWAWLDKRASDVVRSSL